MSNTNHFREVPERCTQGSVGESEKGQVPAATNTGISFSSCWHPAEQGSFTYLYFHEQTDTPSSPRKMIWTPKVGHRETWNFLFKKFNAQVSIWANPARWQSVWIPCFERQLLCILQLDIFCSLPLCMVGDAQANVTHQGNSTSFVQIFHPER